MSITVIGIIFLAYTFLLFLINFIASKRADNDTYFRGNRKSPWFVVAYGMLGASLSGVTFMSVPGNVLKENFYYLPMVFGFIAGYVLIATVLLPIYYRMNLTSIYTYLDRRFGVSSYKSGASYFLISRMLGSSLRMFLVVSVLYEFVFAAMGIPFWVASVVFMLLILGYTFKGGIKTIVWTDTLQTTFMLASVVITLVAIQQELGWSWGEMVSNVMQSPMSEVFDTNPMHPRFFVKQFLSGLFVCVAMTGLDQDMMQKNLSCKNLRDAQKNMFTFGFILLLVNILFLFLGAILGLYVQNRLGVDIQGIKDTDLLFPTVALRYLGPVTGVMFVMGVLSAAYSSADGTLTALTTSFTLDILGYNPEKEDEKKIRKTRQIVHIGMAVLFVSCMCLFYAVKNGSVINMVYDIASYTYGPLLGMFFVGICTSWKISDRKVPIVVIASPLLSYLIVYGAKVLFSYRFGFETLLLNGLLTIFGLFLIREK